MLRRRRHAGFRFSSSEQDSNQSYSLRGMTEHSQVLYYVVFRTRSFVKISMHYTPESLSAISMSRLNGDINCKLPCQVRRTEGTEGCYSFHE